MLFLKSRILFISTWCHFFNDRRLLCINGFRKIKSSFSLAVPGNTMIPTLKSFRLICRLGTKFGGIPFEWSEEDAEIRLVDSRFLLWKWYFGVVIMGTNNLFVIIRCVQATCCMNVPYGKLFITIFSAVTACSCSVINASVVLHHPEMITAVNQIWKVNEKILRHGGRRGVSIRQTSPALFYCLYAYAFLQFFSAIVNVDTPKYVWSLFNLSSTPKWKLIPIGLIDMSLIVSGASTLSFSIVFFITYVISTKESLKFLRNANMSAQEFTAYYRILQLMNSLYTSCSRYLINTCIFETTMLAYVISCFIVFKLHGEIHRMAAFAFGTVIAMTTLIVRNSFHNSYRIRQYSQELIHVRFLQFGHRKYVRKILQSMRPLGVYVGDYFIINQSTTFTFINLAISNTITLMVLF